MRRVQLSNNLGHGPTFTMLSKLFTEELNVSFEMIFILVQFLLSNIFYIELLHLAVCKDPNLEKCSRQELRVAPATITFFFSIVHTSEVNDFTFGLLPGLQITHKIIRKHKKCGCGRVFDVLLNEANVKGSYRSSKRLVQVGINELTTLTQEHGSQ